MGESRRNFLVSLGSLSTIPLLKDLFALEPPNISPVSKLEPIDSHSHTVAYNSMQDIYQVEVVWEPINSLFETGIKIEIPEYLISSLKNDTIRNPLQIYERSLDSTFGNQIAPQIESQIQLLAQMQKLREYESAKSNEDIPTWDVTPDRIAEQRASIKGKRNLTTKYEPKQFSRRRFSKTNTKQSLHSFRYFYTQDEEEMQDRSQSKRPLGQLFKTRKQEFIGKPLSDDMNETIMVFSQSPYASTLAAHKPRINIKDETTEEIQQNTNQSSVQTSENSSPIAYSELFNLGFEELTESWKSKLVPELVRFVQQIQYKQDYAQGLPIDYPLYPSEILYLGMGDCEDSSILLATLLENLETIDIRTALIFPPGHMAVLAAIPDLPDSYKYTTAIEIDGVPYTFFETTKPTEIYDHPRIGSVEPLAVYKDGEFRKINAKTAPASIRRAVQIFKQGLLASIFS